MARTPFKMRSGNSTPFKKIGSSPVKQDTTSVQDKTRTKKPKEVKILKFDAENAWKMGDKDKYNLMSKQQHRIRYNESAKRIDDANKELTTKFTDKEKQKIIDKDLTKYMNSEEFHNY